MKWLSIIIIAIVLVAYIAIDTMADKKAEDAIARSFPMRYVIGYIDSMFMEQNKYIEMIASTVIYHNFILQEVKMGDSVELAIINRALSGDGKDEMMQSEAMEDNIETAPSCTVGFDEAGEMGLYFEYDTIISFGGYDTLYQGKKGSKP